MRPRSGDPVPPARSPAPAAEPRAGGRDAPRSPHFGRSATLSQLASGRGGERTGAAGAMEQWRQCGRWLIDCKVLPPNHRVVWPSAVVFDLAQALRDGVLLCQLLHNLSPGSIDLKDINFRPQMSQVRVLALHEGFGCAI